MPDSSADRNPVERLAEEFLERRRRGENPPLSEYVDRHPEWAEEIRELFPALLMMERLKPAPGDVTGTYIDGEGPRPGRVPERLGDFRILREVGRGGMGIVFEAEQQSLGRHVALKVLPAHTLLDPRHLQRFLREARAAARLHHTNIVPVFGVGESDGLHYYVMQFIAGSGLHEVVDELRQLKAVAGPPAGADPSPLPTRSAEVARGLLTGRFAATVAGPGTEPGADTPDARPAHGSPEVSAGSSILLGSGRNFARSVARVGLQVSEALSYAHGQGVLHRDIKPSNLLLDVQGTVWVADFGLAKALADGDDLTNEGDVLGTLRYMAPERFRGESDARSDVYALGLTLYELLTLRPAFDENDRDRLIHQVTTSVPPRPRAINPEIPRDLETIVLKATEHDPARRYEDAQALADDLERFLADLPIRARRVGALERAGKWARRKPAVAGLLAALALALVAGFAGVTWQWREAVAARDEARNHASRARTNFAHALDTVNTFCTQVSEEQLLDQPGMRPLRRRLLELALKYYRTFQRQQGDDPTLMMEMAETSMRSGIITNELGDAVEAHLAFLRAEDILAGIVRAKPEEVKPRLLLAQCHIESEYADRLNELNNTYTLIVKRSIPGISLMEPLVAADPQNPEYLRLLGRSYNMDALSHLRSGRYSESRAHFAKAIATLGRARRAAPDDDTAARWLALAYCDLGLLEHSTGRHADGVLALGRALAIYEELEPRFAASRRHRLDRAQCLVQLGMARIDLGQFGQAATPLRDAHDRLGRLFDESPDAVDARYWLAIAKRGLGEVALAQGRRAAGPLVDEAIKIHERAPAGSLSGRDLVELAWSYLWLGRAKLQSGQPGEVPPLRGQLTRILEAIKARSVVGYPLPNQALEIVQIETLIEPILVSARKATVAEQIVAGRQQVRTRQSQVGKLPDNPALRLELACERIQFAGLLGDDGQAAEALSSLDLAFRSLGDPARDDPENLRLRHARARAWETRARVQSRSGRPAEARASAGQAVAIAEDLARTDAAYSYDLACMFALRGAVSSSDADATAAVAALQRAIAAGFDNDHQLRTDPRLDGLRSRPDFPAPGRTARANLTKPGATTAGDTPPDR